MSYQVVKFEVDYNGESITVAVHVVTDGEETNHIISLEGHENFEIKPDELQHWKAESNSGLSEELLKLIVEKYESLNH